MEKLSTTQKRFSGIWKTISILFNRPVQRAAVPAMLLILLTSVQAQDRSVNALTDQDIPLSTLALEGIVLDENSDPLPGANVYLKGTTTGTVADERGEFQFPDDLREGDVLVFSFIGYETQEVVITNDTPDYIEVRMVVFTGITGAPASDDVYTSRSGLGRFWDRITVLFK